MTSEQIRPADALLAQPDATIASIGPSAWGAA
jgi:hypothetical protein